MSIQEWLITLDADQLDRLETAVYQERCKRDRPAVPNEVVDLEVDRLLAVQAARRKEAARLWEEHVARTLERRIKEFEEGRLGMCSCRDCLAGYVARDVARMCRNGQWQFGRDANRWQPYTP